MEERFFSGISIRRRVIQKACQRRNVLDFTEFGAKYQLTKVGSAGGSVAKVRVVASENAKMQLYKGE
jgi:hypothetical protein